MIKLIGAKRAIMLGAVLMLNLLIAAAYLFVIEPMREDEEAGLASANASVAQLSGDTQNIKNELAAFPANYARYEALGKNGFFSQQDRFEASRVLDALRAQQTGMLGYTYTIDAIKAVPSVNADAAQARLIDSRVTLEHVSAALDSNVYGLMNNLLASFPQHIRLNSFHARKIGEVNEAALDAMSKAPVGLVDAAIVFDWLTVVPADQPAAGQQGGFRGR